MALEKKLLDTVQNVVSYVSRYPCVFEQIQEDQTIQMPLSWKKRAYFSEESENVSLLLLNAFFPVEFLLL